MPHKDKAEYNAYMAEYMLKRYHKRMAEVRGRGTGDRGQGPGDGTHLGRRSKAVLSTLLAASRCPCASSSSAKATRRDTTSGTAATASA